MSPTITGTIGWMPSGIRNPAATMRARKVSAFFWTRWAGDGSSISMRNASREDAATAGGSAFEKSDVRERCRRRSTTGAGPVVKPPAAEPIALPSVDVKSETRFMTPSSSAEPRPVFPRTPVAWESSTTKVVSYVSQRSANSRSGPISPSMEKTPSVMKSRRLRDDASFRVFSRAARSPCGVTNLFALHRRTPSMIEAWLRASVRRPSSSERSGAKSPSFAFQQDM